MVDEWSYGQWYEKWKNKPTCSYQKLFAPFKGYRSSLRSSRKETIINRLRLNQTKLLGDKYKVGLSDDELCPDCKVLQNGMHLLMSCINTEELRNKIKNMYRKEKLWTYTELLSDKTMNNIIAEFIIEKSIQV